MELVAFTLCCPALYCDDSVDDCGCHSYHHYCCVVILFFSSVFIMLLSFLKTLFS